MKTGIGMFLCALLAGTACAAEPSAGAPSSEVSEMQDALAKLLSKIDGAGRVEVLLSLEYGAESYYQSDENTPASSTISAYLYFPMRPSAGWSFFRMPGECLSASMSAFLPVWRGFLQCRRSAFVVAPRSGFR